MEIIKNRCFAGKCVHKKQGSNNMFCNAPNRVTSENGRGLYIYPILKENCDCGSYKQENK